MTTKEIVTRIKEANCNLSEEELTNSIENLIQFRIAGLAAEKELSLIGQHITEPKEPFYKCINLGPLAPNRNDGVTLGNLYKVLPDGSFFDDDGDKRIEMSEIYLDMKNPIYITEPESIKPEDMVKGEWYWWTCTDYEEKAEWVCRFDKIGVLEQCWFNKIANIRNGILDGGYLQFALNDTIRKATREEVTKYFPNEFDKEIAPHNQI